MAVSPPTFTEFRYTLREEENLPEEERTVFMLKPLTFLEQELVAGSMTMRQTEDDVEIEMKPMERARRVLNFGLMDWQNFRDANGKEVRFAVTEKNGRRRLEESTLDAISPWWIELSNAITERSPTAEGTAKNSGSP